MLKEYKIAHTEKNKYGTEMLNLELLPFHDRETYLAWRKLWRSAYNELSESIREKKKQRKLGNSEEKSSAQSQAASLSLQATAMMLQRSCSKQKCAKLYKPITTPLQNENTCCI